MFKREFRTYRARGARRTSDENSEARLFKRRASE
jgi:hypothetical protein